MLSLSKTLCYAFITLSVGVKAQEVGINVSLGDYEPASRSNSKVAVSWYAGFHADKGFPLSNVSWNKYTHLTYSFAETTPDARMLTLNGSNPDVLPEFVSQAKKHGVKALVSVGGWTGSRWFSSSVSTPQNRTLFVKTLTDFARKYKLDGLDFDWEYPGRQGIGCNTISPSDTASFLSLLQELRKDPLGAKLTLSAAVSITPFAGPDGNPMTDVSAFAKVLDWIAIMNYDIWGPWSPTVGPNAPLNDSCAIPANQVGSAVSAVNKWNAAGIPSIQLVLGVPAYGHSFRVRRSDALINGTMTLAPYPKFDANDRPTGDAWDDPEGVDECGAPQLPGGNMNFWALVEQGYLTQDGMAVYGVPHSYDTCSQTAYVYNLDKGIMVSYDNAESFAAKGKFIQSKGLRGFSIWETGGDYNNILVNAIRKAVGFH
ncbi:Chitinase A1 [Leucoagaricus sp. SymC.cos]|nr:Chitinase A1 [Leucoagaricus sp. SymC.cos]